MRSIRLMLLAALLLPRQVYGCSIIYVLHLSLAPRGAEMLATPTTDTIFAGPGAVKSSLQEGHNGPVYDRPIYGMVMRVDSATGPGARPGSRVVLVPWDYGPDCHPVPWGSSFLWRRLGTYGLYSGTLRDSAYWAGGLPTYDVGLPESEPYTGRQGGIGSDLTDVPALPPLTPQELFAVLRGFPVATTQREIELADSAAFRWAVANPEIAKRPPLAEALSFAGYDRWRIRDFEWLARGTYRVTFTIGADSAVFFSRTSHKLDVWEGLADTTPGGGTRIRIAPGGFSVSGWNVPSEANFSNWEKPLTWQIAKEPTSSAGGAKTWKGVIWSDMIPPGNSTPEMAKAVKQLPFELLTTFTVAANGAATFEHRSRLADGRPVIVRGVRVSTTVY